MKRTLLAAMIVCAAAPALADDCYEAAKLYGAMMRASLVCKMSHERPAIEKAMAVLRERCPASSESEFKDKLRPGVEDGFRVFDREWQQQPKAECRNWDQLMGAMESKPSGGQSSGHADNLQDAVRAAERGDFETAFRLLTPLAQAGNAEAQYHLGIMYYYGEFVEKSFAKALMWRLASARQGHAGAQADVGVMYANGQGVRKDHFEAVKWFQRSAEQGNAIGQQNLARSYELGQGVRKDKLSALEWYLKAAKQGDNDSQFKAARIYESGEGMDRSARQRALNARQAARLYALAAIDRHRPAQLALAKLYQAGESVDKDIVHAHMWFTLASGETGGGVTFDTGSVGIEAKRLRARLESQMTRQQLETSRAMMLKCEKTDERQGALAACGVERLVSDP